MEGTKWKVGDGKAVRFCDDIWVEDEPFKTIARIPVPEEVLSKTVCSIGSQGVVRNGILTSLIYHRALF